MRAATPYPLTKSQIDAAGSLHGRLTQWRLSDAALQHLQRTMPGFGLEEALIKVTVIDALYGTNVYAVTRMGEHVHRVLRGTKSISAETVDLLAAMPARAGESPRRHVSFASKFAHFFVSPERFPIFDSHAARMLRLHLGRGPSKQKTPTYVEWLEFFRELQETAGNTSSRELDRYLWLAGLVREWRRKGAEAEMNVEVRVLLESADSETMRLVEALEGVVPVAPPKHPRESTGSRLKHPSS